MQVEKTLVQTVELIDNKFNLMGNYCKACVAQAKDDENLDLTPLPRPRGAQKGFLGESLAVIEEENISDCRSSNVTSYNEVVRL